MINYNTSNKKYLNKQEEIELFEEYQKNKSEYNKNKIMQSFARLAFHYSRKMSFKKNDYEDLTQEAFLGLAQAIEKFDPKRGCRFLFFASYFIKARIYSYIFSNYLSVHVPANPKFMRGFWRIKRMYDETNEELSKKLDLPIESIEMLKNIVSNPEISINAGDGLGYRMDKISLKKSLDNVSITAFEQNIINQQEQNIQLNKINNQLHHLNEQEKDVFLDYFMEEKTLKEIGKKYNLTRQRIEQIKNKATKKIKQGIEQEL